VVKLESCRKNLA